MLINNRKYVQSRENICRQLREHVLDNKISVEEIALKTGLVKSNVNRVLNGMYAPKLDHVIAIADAIGYEFKLVEMNNNNSDNIDGVTYTFYPDKEGYKRIFLNPVEKKSLDEIKRLSDLSQEQVLNIIRVSNINLSDKDQVNKLINYVNKGYRENELFEKLLGN